MAKQVIKNSDRQSKKNVIVQPAVMPFLFGRRNYIVLFAGLAILAIGFLFMTGGSQPPNQFDESVVYSFRRITLSTIFVVLGFVVILFSIFQKHTPRDLFYKSSGKEIPL